jgi:hypothetical protein
MRYFTQSWVIRLIYLLLRATLKWFEAGLNDVRDEPAKFAFLGRRPSQ